MVKIEKKVEQALSKIIGTKFQQSEKKMNSAINYPWNEPLILIESLMLGSLKFLISLNSKSNLKIQSNQHRNYQSTIQISFRNVRNWVELLEDLVIHKLNFDEFSIRGIETIWCQLHLFA